MASDDVSGLPLTPKLSDDELEKKLVYMFKQMKATVMHADIRCSFSYSYLIHKFIQILGHDEYLSTFPLRGSEKILKRMDVNWKKICEDLGWKFVPSLPEFSQVQLCS